MVPIDYRLACLLSLSLPMSDSDSCFFLSEEERLLSLPDARCFGDLVERLILRRNRVMLSPSRSLKLFSSGWWRAWRCYRFR